MSYGRLTLESWLDSELWQTNTWELEVSEIQQTNTWELVRQ